MSEPFTFDGIENELYTGVTNRIGAWPIVRELVERADLQDYISDSAMMLIAEWIYNINKKHNPGSIHESTVAETRDYFFRGDIYVPTANGIIQLVGIEIEQNKEGILPVERDEQTNLKKIALTFDDGPHASGYTDDKDYTYRMLRILRDHGDIKATFFVDFQRINDRNNSISAGGKTLQRIHEDGHEIGIHGCDPGRHHALHQSMSKHKLKINLSDMKKQIEKCTGISSSARMSVRPPGGWATLEQGWELLVQRGDKPPITPADIRAAYEELNLTLHLGAGTGGRQSWRYVLNENEKDQEYGSFIENTKNYLKSNNEIVLLFHDIKISLYDHEKLDTVFFKDMEEFTKSNNYEIQYVHIRELWDHK